MTQQRVDNLFAGENWTTVYTAFTNISLKAYDFDTIREALLTYVSQTYPDKFNDFIASSEFIAILDLVAYLGHSLAFRTDLNSRENFLDTAERRESILRLAKTLGYEKSRPTNARGFLKITSISTNEPLKDSNGVSLANKRIYWNDSNNDDWYDDFATILNSSLTKDSKIDDPAASVTLVGSENYIHYINENPDTKSTRYAFKADINTAKRNFEVVRVDIDGGKILESEPNRNNNMTIIARDDNLGPASDRTGFFMFCKAGELKFKDVDYTNKLTNRIERINDLNISNTDIWVQKLTNSGQYQKSVTLVDNTTRQNAIYNALKNNTSDLASVRTREDNTVDIVYPDGIYGNAAYGKYRMWYRIADNSNFTVNRDDIKNAKISIPYIGADGRSYKLTLTLNSTIDFTENYTGENYYSVKRMAPKVYYTQDRMVNGQDYNVLPMSLGSSIITKVKAVNTTFAGNSRFYEMDDVTGHHSTISVTGNDGSLYFEDEELKMEFFLNPLQADIDSFIRNDLVKTISHSIIENQFYYLYRDEIQVRYIPTVNHSWMPAVNDPTNILKGYVSGYKDIREGDFIKIGDYWYKIMQYNPLTETATNSGTLTLDRPAIYGDFVKEIVYGYPKIFTNDQVQTLKDVISDTNVNTFYIAFNFTANEGLGLLLGEDSLNWVIIPDVDVTPEIEQEILNTQLYIKVEYRPGIRRTESRFIATLFGKNIVFESRDQVKFFYSNGNDIVIDNETNKANNDILFINYAEGNYIETNRDAETNDYTITVGYGPVVELIPNAENPEQFRISYAYSGADKNIEYLETNDHITSVNYQYYLVGPNGLTTSMPNLELDSPISDATYDISVAQDITYTTTLIEGDVSSDETLGNITLGPFGVWHTEGNVGNTSSSTYHADDFVEITDRYLRNNGFIGNPTPSFINDLIQDGNLFFADESELQAPVDLDTVVSGDYGTQTPMVTYEVDDDTIIFKFTFFENETSGFQINEFDDDIYLKQLAYSQVTFVSTLTLALEQIFVMVSDGSYVDHENMTLLTPAETGVENTYTIIIWSNDVIVNDVVDVYSGNNTGIELYTYHGRIEATFTDYDYVIYRDKSYDTVGSLIVDKYVTDAGYTDYNKVILSSIDVSGDPYAMIDAITDQDTASYLILETYEQDDISYERVSEFAVAYVEDITTNQNIPETAQIYYDVDADIWYKNNSTTGWEEMTVDVDYTEISTGIISYNSVNYRVTEGKTYVSDEYMSFRWDHYADKDKRIDPSTSNIIDVYVLSTDYVRRVNEWKDAGFVTTIPNPPTTYELNKIMEKVNDKAAIADHVSYIPAKFKFLFGSYADEKNQAVFKVVKKGGTSYTDSEIKSKVAEKVNEYFDLNKWDFGETFYFSELAAYLHMSLSDYIASVVISPKYSTYDFRDMLSITSEPNEIFMSIVSSANVKIIDKLTNEDLIGE